MLRPTRRSTEKKSRHRPRNLSHLRLSWFTRRLRHIARLVQFRVQHPARRETEKTNECFGARFRTTSLASNFPFLQFLWCSTRWAGAEHLLCGPHFGGLLSRRCGRVSGVVGEQGARLVILGAGSRFPFRHGLWCISKQSMTVGMAYFNIALKWQVVKRCNPAPRGGR